MPNPKQARFTKFVVFCFFLLTALPATSQVITLQGGGPIYYSSAFLTGVQLQLFTLSTSTPANVTLTFLDSLTVFPTDPATGKITQQSVTTFTGKCSAKTATAASQTAVIAVTNTPLPINGCLLGNGPPSSGSLTAITILNATAPGFPPATRGVAIVNSNGINTISITGNNPVSLSNDKSLTLTVQTQDRLPLNAAIVVKYSPANGPTGWLNYDPDVCSKQTTCSVTLSLNPSALQGAVTGSQYVALLTITSNSGSAPILAQYSYTPETLRFVPTTPCRIADTRDAKGPPISGGNSRDFVIPNSACGIPSTAQAYSLNVTAVPPGPLGYMTVWPTGQSRPDASTLNSGDGRIKANAAIVQAGANGAITVFASNDSHVVLDIDGYFVASTSSTALEFYRLAPCRIANTTTGTGSFGAPYLPGGQSRTFPVLSSPCGVPFGAQAYSLNFTVVPRTPLGYLTAWPTGQSQPKVSTLNAPTGAITANAAIVPAGTSGSIDVYVTNDTDVVIDINGYFAAPGANGLALYTLQPCRAFTTGTSVGSPSISGTTDVNVGSSTCGIPSTAQAYVFNATVVPPGPLGYLTLWPTNELQPTVSTLNSVDGSTVSNMAIVPTTGGLIYAFASNPTHLILDISGYFAP